MEKVGAAFHPLLHSFYEGYILQEIIILKPAQVGERNRDVRHEFSM